MSRSDDDLRAYVADERNKWMCDWGRPEFLARVRVLEAELGETRRRLKIVEDDRDRLHSNLAEARNELEYLKSPVDSTPVGPSLDQRLSELEKSVKSLEYSVKMLKSGARLRA